MAIRVVRNLDFIGVTLPVQVGRIAPLGRHSNAVILEFSYSATTSDRREEETGRYAENFSVRTRPETGLYVQ